MRGRDSGSGRASAYRIVEVATGREVVTTEQAAAERGITVASMRKDAQRRLEDGRATRLDPLDGRTPVYYPVDLGLEAHDDTAGAPT